MEPRLTPRDLTRTFMQNSETTVQGLLRRPFSDLIFHETRLAYSKPVLHGCLVLSSGKSYRQIHREIEASLNLRSVHMLHLIIEFTTFEKRRRASGQKQQLSIHSPCEQYLTGRDTPRALVQRSEPLCRALPKASDRFCCR